MNIQRHRLLFLCCAALLIAAAVWFFRGKPNPASSKPAVQSAAASGEVREVVADAGRAKTSGPAVLSGEKWRTFASFADWQQAFAAAAPDARGALLVEGLRLAAERRAVMTELIERDPRVALRRAVTLEVWRGLPPEVRAQVEEPFSALAHFRVLPVCVTGSPDAGRVVAGEKFRDVVRLTEIAGRAALESFVFGRREALATKENSPVQGIRLGGVAALREEVFHVLEPREVVVAEAVYPQANPQADRDFATGRPLGAETVTALAGGKIFKFENRATFEGFSAAVGALDELPGPHAGASVLFLAAPAPGASGEGFNLDAAVAQSQIYASS